MDPDEEPSTPPEVRAIAEQATASLLPSKSKPIYDKNHDAFISWCKARHILDGYYSETILLAYFSELSARYASTTLWSKFSMLRTTLTAHGFASLGALGKVAAFLKRAGEGKDIKKSSVFTRADIERFLCETPDEQYLHIKVATLFGLFGACRKSELIALTPDDVKDAGDHLLVSIRHSKTGPRSFVLVGADDPRLDALVYHRRYLQLRPENSPNRLFVSFKNGKCVRQPLGKNIIASYPKMIADFLGLPNPATFTSHALRRSSATWMADGGVDLMNLKRFGGWKADAAAQGYIAESTTNKRMLAEVLQGDSIIKLAKTTVTTSASISSSVPSFQVSECKNCTFNITINK